MQQQEKMEQFASDTISSYIKQRLPSSGQRLAATNDYAGHLYYGQTPIADQGRADLSIYRCLKAAMHSRRQSTMPDSHRPTTLVDSQRSIPDSCRPVTLDSRRPMLVDSLRSMPDSRRPVMLDSRRLMRMAATSSTDAMLLCLLHHTALFVASTLPQAWT